MRTRSHCRGREHRCPAIECRRSQGGGAVAKRTRSGRRAAAPANIRRQLNGRSVGRRAGRIRRQCGSASNQICAAV